MTEQEAARRAAPILARMLARIDTRPAPQPADDETKAKAS